MNRIELKERLIENKIKSDYFSLFPPYPNHECLCLVNENSKWLVYFIERNQRNDLKIFDTEEEACEYFFLEALSDKSNRL